VPPLTLPTADAIPRTSTAEQVALALRDGIMRGDLPPGAPLRETSVASATGVSRNTVREALRLLVIEGLVVHHRHRGASVVVPSEAEVVDVFRTREVLELGAIDAWPTAAASARSALAGATDAFVAAARDRHLDHLSERDLAFHTALVGLLGSRRSDAFFATVRSEVQLYVAMLYGGNREWEDPVAVAAEHAAVHDALARGRIATARRLMRELLVGNRELLLAIVRDRAAASP
jgi:DNA-binding GntR family transcriptional regulator